MIPVRSSQHLRRILAHLRETNGMTRRTLAERLFVTQKTIGSRNAANTDGTPTASST